MKRMITSFRCVGLSVILLVFVTLTFLSCSGDSETETAALESRVVTCTEPIPDLSPGVDGKLTYDSDRGRLIFVSDKGDQIWERVEDRWIRILPPHIPKGLEWCEIVYFPPARQVILLGGLTDATNDPDSIPQMWIYDSHDWREDSITPLPAMIMGKLAYDSHEGRILYTAGQLLSGYPFEGEIWAYDGVAWEILPLDPGLTHPCQEKNIAYDQGLNRLVMICETYLGCGSYIRGTWAYSGTGWQLINDELPDYPDYGTIVYDRQREELYLITSYDYYTSTDLTRVYRLDDTTWQLISDERGFHPGTTDVFSDHDGLVYTLSDSSTLGFSPESGWLDKSSPLAPVNHWQVNNAAWSPELQGIVMVLANACYSDRIEAWVWDGDHFSHLPAEFDLPYESRIDEGDPLELVFDEANNRLLLFEQWGKIYVLENDMWRRIFNGNATRFGYGFSACYFPDHHSIIIFGGSRTISKTWEFVNDTLTRITTEHNPTPSTNHRLVYDQYKHALVLFGGESEACLNETWEFDGQDWRYFDFTTAPDFRGSMAMGYDPLAGGVVISGGSCGLEMFRDVWRLTDHTWIKDEIVGIDANRTMAASAFDPIRKCLVVCGGKSGEMIRGSLLELSYESDASH